MMLVTCPRCQYWRTRGCILCTGRVNGSGGRKLDRLAARPGQVSAELAAAYQLRYDDGADATTGVKVEEVRALRDRFGRSRRRR